MIAHLQPTIYELRLFADGGEYPTAKPLGTAMIVAYDHGKAAEVRLGESEMRSNQDNRVELAWETKAAIEAALRGAGFERYTFDRGKGSKDRDTLL